MNQDVFAKTAGFEPRSLVLKNSCSVFKACAFLSLPQRKPHENRMTFHTNPEFTKFVEKTAL